MSTVRWGRVVALIWSVSGGPIEAQSAPARVGGVPDEMAARFEAALDAWAEAPQHRGVSASVILADGSQWVGTAGVEREGTPLRPEHLIWVASITKSVTGAVILGLAEEGVLDLDDPISEWLGEREHVDPEITLRQLLNHTSGVANFTGTPGLSEVLQNDPAHAFTAEELLGFVPEPAFPRGERTQYTNTAFVLLGQVAERATGRPIHELYHERLWEPLGLEEIFLPGAEEPPGPMAWSRAGDDVVDPQEMTALMTIGNAAFGLHSNARTVARWARALFTNQVFGEAMRREMVDLVPAAGNIPGESGAGLGIRAYSYLGREQWGHSGGSPLGSSLMLYDPETGVTAVVIMNQGRGARHFQLAPELLAIATGE